MLLRFEHPDTGCALVVDAAGPAAWAYLLEPEGDIVGDVWLYNRGPAPLAADWSDPSKAPFPNPASHCRPLAQPPAEDAADFSVAWTVEGELLLADVWLRGVALARLSPGSQPGWNVLATADGPCAKRWAPAP